MNWFQRYGIPGAAFYGFVILWVGAFHKCAIDQVFCDTEIAKVIAAIAAGTFLPIGYLLSVVGQLIYHLLPGIGIDTRARAAKASKIPKSFYNSTLEWQQEMASMQETLFCLMDGKKEGEKGMGAEDIRLVSEWMSKRMGMLVINGVLILAVIAAMFLSLLLKIVLPWQFDGRWYSFALILSVLLWFYCSLSWWILSEQLVRVERMLLDCYHTVDNN